MTFPGCVDEFVVVAKGGQLALVRPRRFDELRARLRARALDRRLAAGAAAESDRLLAVRARQLVHRPVDRLAVRWERVAAAAPQCAEPWLVVSLLRSGTAPARAVAAAAELLPVVVAAVRDRSGADLVAAAARTALGTT